MAHNTNLCPSPWTMITLAVVHLRQVGNLPGIGGPQDQASWADANSWNGQLEVGSSLVLTRNTILLINLLDIFSFLSFVFLSSL